MTAALTIVLATAVALACSHDNRVATAATVATGMTAWALAEQLGVL